MLQDGMKYKDGWGVEQTVGGNTKVNPDWVWTIQGHWFRRSDGRFVEFRLVDKGDPNGARRHIPAARPSNLDLIVT